MSIHFNRLGRVFFLLISISLILSFTGLFYYLNVKKNERYQNQLHFRELSQIQVSFEKGMDGFASVGKKLQKTVDYLSDIREKDSISEQELEQFSNNFNEIKILSKKQNDSYTKYSAERKDWYDWLEEDELNKKLVKNKKITLKALSFTLKQAREQLGIAEQQEEEVEARLDTYPDIETFIDDNALDDIVSQCDLDDSFCNTVSGWFESLYDVSEYTNKDSDTLRIKYIKRYSTIICQSGVDNCDYIRLNNILSDRKRVLQKVKGILTEDTSVPKDVNTIKLELLCDDPIIWASEYHCEDVIDSLEYLSMQTEPMHENQQVTLVNRTPQILREEASATKAHNVKLLNVAQHLNRLELLEKEKAGFLNKTLEFLVSNDIVNQRPQLLSEYNQAKNNTEAKLEGVDNAKEAYNTAEQQVVLQNKSTELNDGKSSNFTSYNNARRKYIQFNGKFERLIDKLTKKINYNIGQLNEPYLSLSLHGTLIKIYKDKMKLIKKDFFQCLQESLITKEYEIASCLKKFRYYKVNLNSQDFSKNEINAFFEKSQTLTQTAFPSIEYLDHKELDSVCSGATLSTGFGYRSEVTLLSPAQTNQRGKWKLAVPIGKQDIDVKAEGVNCDEKEDLNYGKLTISFDDLLPNNTEFFPLVLVVDDSGRLMFRKENVEAGSFQSGLYFEMTDELLKTLAKKQSLTSVQAKNMETVDVNVNTKNMELGNGAPSGTPPKSFFPGYSGKIDVTISGEKYSVFISPWNGFSEKPVKDAQVSAAPLFYLIGVTPKSKLTVNTLAIPNSTLVAIVFCLLAIIALIPILKVRLVSYRQSFTQNDRQNVAIGLSILTILLMCGTFNTLVYQHWKEEIKNLNVKAYKQLQISFNKEIESVRKLAELEYKTLKGGVQLNPYDDDLRALRLILRSTDELKKSTKKYNTQIAKVFLENAFLVKKDGIIEVNGNYENPDGKVYGKWSSDALMVQSTLPIGHRNYFKVARDCQGWYTRRVDNDYSNQEGYESSCRDSIYLQRLMNLVDGRKTTQFSKPLFDSPVKDTNDNHVVYSFGGRLKTFLSPILPMDSGFAVIENSTGNVLYHSDDERSLVENIFVETDNNSVLRSVINSPFKKEHIEFVSTYRGKAHLFVAGSINEKIPWTLIVFHDKENVRNLSMLMSFSAVIVLFLLVILCQVFYMVLRAVDKGHYVRSIVWFNMKFVTQLSYQSLIFVLLVLNTIGLYVAWQTGGELSMVQLSAGIAGYWILLWVTIIGTRKGQGNINSGNLKSHSPRNTYLIPAKHDVDRYAIYVIVLLFAFWSVPSFIVTSESARFYLQKYANIEYQRVNLNAERAQRIQKNYFELVVARPDSITDNVTYKKHIEEYVSIINLSGQATKNDPKNSAVIKHWLHIESKSKESAHGIFSSIWKNINLGFKLASDISIYTEIEDKWLPEEKPKEGDKANDDFKTIVFMEIFKDALFAFWAIALLFIVIGSVFLWWLMTRWVCGRLMGLYIPQNLRLNDSDYKRDNRDSLLKRMAIGSDKNHKGQYAQLIRSTGRTRRMFSKTEYVQNDESLNDLIDDLNLLTDDPVAFSDLRSTGKNNIANVLENKLNIEGDDVVGTIVLTGLEMASMDNAARLDALNILNELVSKKHLNIILLADIAPLFRLTRQSAYPNAIQENQASAHEVIHWCRLLKRFVKYYDWTPRSRRNLLASATSYEVLRYESKSWPELKTIFYEFLEYHTNVKDTGLKFIDKKVKRDSELLSSEMLAKSINDYWLPEQVVEFFSANAGATYRYRWELCTQEERLLLIQLARGDAPNPLHIEPIEHMVRRGYLYQYNGWHLVNKSFTRYLITAEDEQTVATWMKDASESSWKYIRIPLYVIMIVILGMLAYTATDAFESFAAILTATLGILPLVLRSIGLVKGDTSSLTDN